MGYLIAIIFEYIIFGYEYCLIASTVAFGIGAYLLGIAATKEFQDFLHLINDNAQSNANQSHGLMLLFAEYVDTHATIKQLSIFSAFQNNKHGFVGACSSF